MSAAKDLLKELEDFCAANGLAETKFGELAMNDPALLLKMRRGRSVRIDTDERLRAFMASYVKVKDGKPRPKHEAFAA